MEHQPVETTLYSLAATAPERPERRSSERFLSLLRVGAIVIGERRELCLIRNISAGGMMIRAYSDIVPGTPLSVEFKHGDPVSGVVQWVENELTGVAFEKSIDVVALLASGGDGPRPRLPRIEISCSASVREDGEVIRVNAVNISQGGICVEAAAPLTSGADVVVRLAGLPPTPGVVKWHCQSAYGIGFNRGLPLPALVEWLQAQQEEQRREAGAKR